MEKEKAEIASLVERHGRQELCPLYQEISDMRGHGRQKAIGNRIRNGTGELDITGTGKRVLKLYWDHMHESIADTIVALNVKRSGHYRYYGIYGNYIGLVKYFVYVRQEMWKSKRRRDQTYWL